jgi:hypothetical protein
MFWLQKYYEIFSITTSSLLRKKINLQEVKKLSQDSGLVSGDICIILYQILQQTTSHSIFLDTSNHLIPQ